MERGYNRDKEKLPQVNLLMVVSQKSKMPAWIELLPGSINDAVTLRDLMAVVSKIDGSPNRFVLDRGFASMENIEFMVRNRIKFTMGIPLAVWTNLLKEAQQLFDANEFFSPDAILDGVEYNGCPVHAVTKLRYIQGHRVYDHFFYSDRLAGKDNAELSRMVKAVSEKLRKGGVITAPAEQAVAEACFIVKKTPKRGVSVKALPDAVAQLRKKEGGFFVIRSNQFKSAADALETYRLRDGIEKQFDDMKNQGDMKRLRVHSAHNMRARIFLQFIAQILRCDVQQMLKESGQPIPGVKSPSDFYRLAEPIRTIELPGHRPINKRPTKSQLIMLGVSGVQATGPAWPGLNKAAK